MKPICQCLVVLGQAVLVGAIGCGPGQEMSKLQQVVPTDVARPTGQPVAGVRWFGALRAIMHDGHRGSSVKLADVSPGPHAWGLGALEGLNGEVTILDDTVWLALPRADGTAEIRRGDLGGPDAEQGATLLVVANVAAWHEVPVTREVFWGELDDFLEQALRTRGVSLESPIALRIEGPMRSVRWHVVDGSKLTAGAGHAEHARTAVSGLVDTTDARLVGFFSTKHEGVFTHAGARSHFHVLVEGPLLSGHVDAVDLLAGTRLFVAAK